MASALSLVLTPLCQRLAAATGFLDVPKGQMHKQHAKATPLLGGVAIFGAWIATVGLGFLASGSLKVGHMDRSVAEALTGVHLVTGEFAVICLCAFAALLLGLYDDKRPLKAWVKLMGQIAIAVATATWGGVKISVFIQSDALSWCMTVFWLLFIFNSINFFDNMDGLAVGTAFIAFSFFTIAAASNQQFFVASLGAAAAGASIGFWFYNHSPASIFMGDGGSHVLGYLLGVISAKVTYFTPGVSTTHFTILIPLFILAVPVFDTLAVVAIRLYNRKPVYVGDHNHISHRFLHMGMNRKTAVLLVHLTALVAGLGALPLLWGDERTCVVLLIQGACLLLLMSILQYSGKARGSGSSQGSPPEQKGESKQGGQ